MIRPPRPPHPQFPGQQPPQHVFANQGVGGAPVPPRFQQPGPNYGYANNPSHSVQKYEFPLAEACEFRLCCDTCMRSIEMGLYRLHVTESHNCTEDHLAVRSIGEDYWVRIRERKKHRNFPGVYKMCRHMEQGAPCYVGEENCSFAHSYEEQSLWTLEKDGLFSISEFIHQNRSHAHAAEDELGTLFRKHQGQYQFLCQSCYFGQPPRISLRSKDKPTLCSAGEHPWWENRLLIHINPQLKLTPIGKRPFTHKTAYYLLCHQQQYCQRREQGRCNFAHSNIERDVWNIERDTDYSRDYIVDESHKFVMQTVSGRVPVLQSGQNAQSPQDGSGKTVATAAAAEPAQPEPIRCPYHIYEVCELCWKQGNKCGQDKKRDDRCVAKGMGHRWSQNKICILHPSSKIIRPLPRRLPMNCGFIICKYVQSKKKCEYTGGGHCQFAHHDQEKEVWTWMVKNKGEKI